MRNLKSAILIPAIITACVLAGCGSKSSTQLVPAWELFSREGYRGVLAKDPFVSWAPDSKSLLISGVTFNSNEYRIMKWDVGGKKLEKIGEGLTPNYISDNEYIYFVNDPKGIYQQNLETGEKKEILTPVKTSTFWSEASGICYDHKTKSVALRLTEFTPRYLRSVDWYDMDGKPVDNVTEEADPDVVECSDSPAGDKCALLVQEDSGGDVSLEIADKGKQRGKQIASGPLYGVAWSPADDAVAYGDGKQVVVARPDDGKKVAVARFGKSDDTSASFVSRLSWSPDGKYLAVLYYVSSDSGDFPLVYVLDMTQFKWDR